MSTLAKPPAAPQGSWVRNNEELRQRFEKRRNPDDFRRIRYAAIGSVLVHVIFILGALNMPHQQVTSEEREERRLRVTTLIDPPTELTQQAPNKAPISKTLTVESIAPSPKITSPAPGAQARKFVPPPPEQVKAPRPAPGPAVVEPPKIEQAQNSAPPLPQIQLPPAQPVEKPKLAFENVPQQRPTSQPKGGAPIAVPGSSVQDAVRALSHGGSTSGQSVGNSPTDLGTGAGMNLPPSPGRQQNNLELKSDPMGVDFKPYLAQVFAIVRRNWFSVYPESAKLGTRGQTKVLFAITKNGTVSKVVYGQESGLRALDYAAISALSMSNPLPALPTAFKGDRIVLEMTFSYNVPLN